MEGIQQNLQQLQLTLKSTSVDRHDEAAQLARDLYSLCLERGSDTELAYTTSVLFSSEDGVLQFLRASANMDEFSACKEELLRLLVHYLQALSKTLLPYTVDIKDVCLTLFARDKTSKVKAAIFPVLTEVLQLCARTAVAPDLNVPQIGKRFFEACMKPAKLTATVRGGVFHILGTLCEMYPEHMTQYSDKLVDVYLRTLKGEMLSKTKKSEMLVIAGCLQGLNGYLTNFEQSPSGTSSYTQDIYRFTRMAIDPEVSLSRFDVPRAGLSLLSNHAALFGELLTRDHCTIYQHLFRWCSHHNREMKWLGFSALEAFLQQVSEFLLKESEEKETRKAIFTEFIKNFRSIIDNKDSEHREMSVAIRGYGYFAAPCRLFMAEADVKFMFNEMIQRSEQLFFSPAGVMLGDFALHHLPNFLEALASILKRIDKLSESFLTSLERLVVVLVEHYPRLAPKMGPLCHKATLMVFLALAEKGPTLQSFVSYVVYQGLIRTCSHQIVLDTGEGSAGVLTNSGGSADGLDVLGTKLPSYLDYIDLWVALCSRDMVKDLRKMPVDVTASLRMVNVLVFDELMAAVLKMISKLDLSSQSVEEGEETATGGASESAPQVGGAPAPDTPSPTQPHLGLSLQPTKPPDFHIFINLVDFFRTVIPKMSPPELLEKWVFTIVHEAITQSSRHPIVSGFYKILGTCMAVCKRINYFRGTGAAGGGGGGAGGGGEVEEMETEALSGLANKRACFSLMKKFTKEVLVRMKQYKDDLVASCLGLLLSLPTELVEEEIQGLMTALQTALRLGLGYPPLARAALDALDTWSTSLPPSLLQPYYRDLLPVLDDYLKAASDEGDKNTLPPTSTSLASKTGKKRLPVKALKEWRETIEGAQSPTALVRLRVIQLLGSLGGQVNKELVTSDSEALKKAVAWDTRKRLEFVLPFQDLKPSVFLDAFLPRVCELALTSSDRQTKIASCELLHAVVLYVVGRGAQPSATKKYPMTKVYQKLFPVILQLACDVERVAEQLFRPLVFQLVHWFTGNTQYESPDTIALLEAFLEGIVHPTDASLRDFSAHCVKEFLQWSIKQTTKQQQEKSPINTKSLLKRLYSLASHPCAAKRLGAALAFNTIYIVLREEKSLVDMFAMEMLVCVINSLKQAHKDPKSLGTQEQMCKSVAHLARIIRAWAALLNKPGKLRRKPRGLRGSEMPHLVTWIVAQCGVPETECRKQCMGLFLQLAPLQQGIPSPREWVKKTVESEGGSYFVQVFENGGQIYSGVLNQPTLSGDTFAVSSSLHWFDLLLGAVDVYTWAMEKKLLCPSEVFVSFHKPSDKDSKLFASLSFFLEHLALEDIHAAAKCFTGGHSEPVFTPHEMDEYNRAKCVVTLGVLRFVSVLLQNHPKEAFSCTPRSFWSEPLYSTVVFCCLSPQRAGFDPGDIETAAKLPTTILDCLKMFASRLHADDKGAFLTFLGLTLLGESSNMSHQLREFPQGVDRSHLKALLTGYLTLNKAGLLKPALKNWSSLAQLLLDSVVKMTHSAAAAAGGGESPLRYGTLDPEEQQLARKLLELALELGIEGKELLKLLFSGKEGHIFYQSLQPQICSHLALNQEAFIPILMEEMCRAPEVATSIIGGIVEQVLRELSLRRRHSSSLYRTLLESWGKLGFLWGERFSLDLRMTAVSLLKKILALEPKGLTGLDKSSFECVFGMLQTLLEETQTGLSFKARVLELLPYFGSAKGTYAIQLRDSLNKMIAAQFPLRSSEFAAGSSQYHEYIAVINKFLSGLVAMETTVLLEVLVGVMCREEVHAHEEQMQMKLVEYVRGLSNNKATAALDSVYSVFMNHSQYDPQVRRAAAERVLLTLLRNCSELALREFFIRHIAEVMAAIEAKETKVSDSHLQTQLSSKICCFKLVEVAYTKLSALDLNSSESQLNEAYNGGDKKTGKELTKAATKMAHATRSEYVLDDAPAVKALRRECHCAAYNLLAAVISCTQIKMDFYNVFLFREDMSKGQMLWDNLVDPNHQYRFAVELDTPLVRKKLLTTIRDEYHTAGREEGENGGSPLSPPPDSTRYLSSVYLTGSSLSQDVSQFDFSTGTQVMPRVSYPSGSGREAGASYVVSEEQVEQDELNTHECMGTLTKLLDHMEHNKINPQVPKGHQPTEMPAWMSSLHKKLTDGKTHNNVRLLITRLITNRPRVFQPYAKFWLPPLTQLVVAGHLGGEGMHYFLVDVMVTMLSWSTTAVLEDSYLATRLLEFLMDHCHHDNRGVFRNNLEIIKTLVECWKDHLTIPVESIYRHFSDSGSDSKQNRTGIQLLGIVLANGLPPYNAGSAKGISEESYYHALVRNLGNKYKEVYAAAAEVVGMTLNYISEHSHTDTGPLHDKIIEQLQSLLQQRNEDRFTVCLHKLSEVYPPLVERLYSKVLFILPGQVANFKALSLETLLTRADSLPNLYQELKAKGFLALLGHRDEAMQLASLQLARVMVRTMSVEQLTEVLPSLTAFSSHSSAQCRSVMYDTLIWVYNSIHWSAFCSSESGGSSQVQLISQTVRDHLLAGLSDDAEINRLKLFEFWNEDSRLPSDTVGRLSQLLATLYSPSTEGQFLSCCTNLMLQLTWRSPDYSRPIFDVPLSECKFQDQSIDLSWQQRHLQMTPLFAATQATQPGSGPVVPMAQGMLRATQQAGAFVPTQDLAPGDSVGYNWMAPMQQSMDSLSFTIGAGSTPAPEPQQSSLLFSLAKAQQPTFKTLKPPGETFGKGTLQLTTTMATQQFTDGKSGQQQEIMRLKRRFHRDRQSTSSFFARLQMRKKVAQEESRQYQKAARDSRIVMYRQYREGELPDIQIKYSELIRPLQALAQRDNVLARQLFSAVFCAVFGQVDRQLPEKEAKSTRKAVEDGMNAVLSASVHYVPSFIGSLLDICFQEKELEVNSHTSASACLASSQQPMGIMVLEKQQLFGTAEDSGHASKRSRGMRQVTSETTSNWIELARLYKSLGEYDVLRGVFSGHIGAQAVTKEALVAEERGDFKSALDLYKEALSKDWGGEPPPEAEEDFWERAQLNCYDHLMKWKDLEQAVEVNIDDHKPPNLDRVWEDTFYQEHYLPYLVRSKLKLASAGVGDTAFDHFLESSLQEESKRVVLESRYSAELAMHYVMKDDYNRAKYYTDISMQGFLQEWSTLSPLFEENRAASLRGLQKIVEVKEFLEFANKTGSVVSVAAIDKLLQKWNSRFPHPKRDPVSVWDDIVTNRCVLMEKMLLRCKNSAADVSMSSMESMEVEYGSSYLKQLQLKFSKEYVKLYFRIAESARLQGNYPVAKHYLQLIDSAIKEHLQDDQELPLRWLWSVTDMRLRQAREDPSPRCIEAIVAIMKQFAAFSESNEMLTSSPDVARQHHLLHATALHHVGDVLLDMATGPRLMGSFTESKLHHLLSVAGTSSQQVEPASLSHQEVSRLLHQKALYTYKQGYKAAQLEQESTNDNRGMVDALVALATFCDKALRAEEEQENPTKLDLKTFPKVVVAYTLKAMQLGSLVARQQFPRLLQLLELYPQTVDDFCKKAKQVPVWMFLGWRNQMMALLDKPEGKALHGIMFSLVRQYPQALCYSFKISSSSFAFDTSTEEGGRNRAAVEEMTTILEMRAVDDFVAALEQLTSPELLWKDLCDLELKPLMEASQRDPEAVKACWQQIYASLLAVEGRSTLSGQSADSLYSTASSSQLMHGQKRKNFGNAYRQTIESKFGKDGAKLISMSTTNFNKILLSLNGDMREKMQRISGSGLLKDYSPWLAEFQANKYPQEIEVPGQYNGDRKPMPEYHVKIAGFDEKILVLNSMRKPKRITIRGGDELEYPFLVKGGEDLRLDQRIEQLFGIMNQVLREDPACCQRGLSLRTYKVVPMTPRVGVIEWMQHTKPLKEFLLEAMTEEEVKKYQGIPKMQQKWLTKYCRGQDLPKQYKTMYRNANRSETVMEYKQKVAMVPWDLSRRAFMQLAASPEAFLMLRSHFTRTYATVCMCHYVLGIGDRHLSNFMVDLHTGGAVGIDFGHAFGTATQFLPLPELIPFRLTPQIINLLRPLSESGQLRSCMVHSMRALRASPLLLLNTMEVFVKEPSLDWKVNARKQAASIGMEEDSQEANWYPREKVDLAKKKLQGFNPAHLIKKDLVQGHGRSPEYSSLDSLLMGDRQHKNVRAFVELHCSSVEEQVACLIDLATDTNILGRTWQGWEPWV